MTTQLPSRLNPTTRTRIGVTSTAVTSTQYTAAQQLQGPNPLLRAPKLKSHVTNNHKEKATNSQSEDRRPPSGIRLQRLDSSRPTTPSLSHYVPLPDIPAPDRSRKKSATSSRKGSKSKILKTDETSVAPENIVAGMSNMSLGISTLNTREKGKQTKTKADDSNAVFQTTTSTTKSGSAKALGNNVKTLHKTREASPIKQNTIECSVVADRESSNSDSSKSSSHKKEQIRMKSVESDVNLRTLDQCSQTKNIVEDNEQSNTEKGGTSSHFVITDQVPIKDKDLVTALIEDNQNSSKEMPSNDPIVSGRDGVSISIVTHNNAAPIQKTSDQLITK